MSFDTPKFSSIDEENKFWKNQAVKYKSSFEETKEEFEEFQTSSRELERELELQLEQQDLKCSEGQQQINKLKYENEILKEKYQKNQSEFCNELTKLQKELHDIQNNKEQLINYIRELEQSNDDLERSQRATVASLEDFESKLNEAIERNAVLESELDEKETLKDMVQRLKDEARDLRQEVNVHKRCESVGLADNDKFMGTPRRRSIRSPTPYIDSNKLSEMKNLSGINEEHPLTPNSRASALNIVGDLLRKVGMKIQQLNKDMNKVNHTVTKV